MKSPHFKQDNYFRGKPHLEDPFLDILMAIQDGTPLPSWAYRRDIDTTPDQLLEMHGIMHLHLGSQSSNELLFLLQFDDHVTLLEISTHKHFETDPPGILLIKLHEAKVAALHAATAEARAEEASAKKAARTAAIRGILKSRDNKPT